MYKHYAHIQGQYRGLGNRWRIPFISLTTGQPRA